MVKMICPGGKPTVFSLSFPHYLSLPPPTSQHPQTLGEVLVVTDEVYGFNLELLLASVSPSVK